MAQQKLSIIMATMGSPHLDKIVKTFLASKQDVEVVVIIDDPKKLPSELFSAPLLEDKRLVIVANEVNIGLTRSLNKAAKMASGDILVRTDDDDFSEPNRLDELVSFFEARPDVDLAFSYAKGVDQATGRSWVIDGPEDNQAIQQKLLERNFIVHSSLAFRRDKLEAIGFYDESFRYAQDYDMYLRAIRSNLVFGCIPKQLVTRLYHNESITVARRKRQILHSMAGRILHAAQSEGALSIWPVIARYLFLLAVPNWARALRRKLGHGK